jgi:Flavodoxin domain
VHTKRNTALIVYESMFGATRRIAEAIAEGLSTSADCTVVEVGHAPSVIGHDVDLLVIGAPTHAFGLSTPETRREAETVGKVISRELGVREWLAGLIVLTPIIRTAAFDTRVKQRWVPGSAAHRIERAAKHKGLTPGAEPMSFRVEGKTGPLLAGELDRAREWGEVLGLELTALAAGRTP